MSLHLCIRTKLLFVQMGLSHNALQSKYFTQYFFTLEYKVWHLVKTTFVKIEFFLILWQRLYLCGVLSTKSNRMQKLKLKSITLKNDANKIRLNTIKSDFMGVYKDVQFAKSWNVWFWIRNHFWNTVEWRSFTEFTMDRQIKKCLSLSRAQRLISLTNKNKMDFVWFSTAER